MEKLPETVEGQYQFFLEKVALREDKMHPVQKTQLRQAFYAAWGQCMFFMDEMNLDTDEAMENAATIVENMMNEVKNFWNLYKPLNNERKN